MGLGATSQLSLNFLICIAHSDISNAIDAIEMSSKTGAPVTADNTEPVNETSRTLSTNQ